MMLHPEPVMLNVQLKDIIKAKIDPAELKGRQRLLPESKTRTKYNNNGAKVRQSVLKLALEGFIRRVRSKRRPTVNLGAADSASLCSATPPSLRPDTKVGNKIP